MFSEPSSSHLIKWELSNLQLNNYSDRRNAEIFKSILWFKIKFVGGHLVHLSRILLVKKITVKEQEWKIPPCISNWKNAKGYAVPLEKHLVADGRGF